ncbi:hypothetical protein MC885_018263 [Smutsia gigantea]|nr:hypothetical protein MC885_018263 [Smutsia gigantea]
MRKLGALLLPRAGQFLQDSQRLVAREAAQRQHGRPSAGKNPDTAGPSTTPGNWYSVLWLLAQCMIDQD